MMREQDDVIIDLGTSVKRVGELADTIHYEVNDQNRLLDDLGEDVSAMQRQLDVVLYTYIHTYIDRYTYIYTYIHT